MNRQSLIHQPNEQKSTFKRQILASLIEIFGASPRHIELFSLVEAVLKQQYTSNKSGQSKIMSLKVAENILVSMPLITLKISSPTSEAPESFLEKMLNIAESLGSDAADHHILILQQADCLIASCHELLDLLHLDTLEMEDRQWDGLHSYLNGNMEFHQAYRQFETRWHNFTIVYLLEYIYLQMNLNKNTISEKLEEICPRIILENEELQDTCELLLQY